MQQESTTQPSKDGTPSNDGTVSVLSNHSSKDGTVSLTLEVNRDTYVIYSASESESESERRSRREEAKKLANNIQVMGFVVEPSSESSSSMYSGNTRSPSAALCSPRRLGTPFETRSDAQSPLSPRSTNSRHPLSHWGSRLSILTSGFEGCEKRLVITFNCGAGCDLRTMDEKQWTRILKCAHCRILGIKSNDVCVAYLLSESSLFVYKSHIIIKTCGTTTLLEILPLLVTTASTVGCSYKYLRYSRSHFMFPHKQEYPHESFQRETEYLDKQFKGLAYVLGPARAARWHLYDAAKFRHPDTEVTLEIVMFDLDRRVMGIFKDEVSDGEPQRCTEKSGITTLLPKDALIHEYVFDPCGYSMNALLGNTYWTIHITPESIGSFVSFETNLVVPNYADLLERVIRLFGPERFSVVVAHKDDLKDHPKFLSSYDKYDRKNWTRTVTSSNFSMSLQTFEKSA